MWIDHQLRYADGMTPRADALRSRERILEAARAIPVRDLRLNDLSVAAGVGVGTVYRHFPTVPALVEALNVDALVVLLDHARAAAALEDPADAFADFVRHAVALLVEREGLQDLIVLPPASPAVAALVGELHVTSAALLASAQAAAVVRADVTVGHIERLVCGIEHAVRLGEESDRALLMDVMLAGLRPGAVAP